jgi:hypothetical protein
VVRAAIGYFLSTSLRDFFFGEKGDFNKKSKFLNVHQRKNLRWVHSAWEPVDDQSKLRD